MRLISIGTPKRSFTCAPPGRLPLGHTRSVIDARTTGSFLLGPLVVVAFDPNGLVPSGPLRVAAVATTVLVLISLSMGHSSGLPRSLRLAGLTFGLWLGVATIFGIDQWHALVGTPDRRFGLLTWLLTLAALDAGSRLGDKRLALARGASLAALGLGVVSLFELAGLHPVGGVDAGGRWSGLFGQPAYLGAAAVFFGLVAAGHALSLDRRSWRIAAAIGAVGALITLAGSGTRAAMVGLVVGTVTVAILLGRRTAAMALGSASAAAGIATTLLSERQFTRFDEWAVGLRGMIEAPLIGYGPEGYRIAFGQLVTADYQRTYGSDVYTDRAHQGLIDLGLVGGIPAVALFITIVAIAGSAIWKRRDDLDPIDLGVVAAVVSYLVAQQALFPIASLEPVVAIYAGMVVAGSCATCRARISWLATAPIALLALAAVVAGMAEVVAERRIAAEAATFAIDRGIVEDAAGLRPDSIRTRYAAAQLLARNSALFDLDAALDQLEQGLRWSPRDPALQQRRVELLLLRAVRSESDADADAVWQAAQDLLDDQPLDTRALAAAAAAARIAGQVDEADVLSARSEALRQENSNS